jgi:hypothetical protein
MSGAREERQRPDAAPAHKFTRANDFMGLSALMRNFLAKRATLRSDDHGRPAGPFRFGPERSQKTGKTKRSFRQAKRNVSQGMA